jgi:hypothetical protein
VSVFFCLKVSTAKHEKNPLFAPSAPTVLAVDTFSTDHFTAPQPRFPWGVSAFLPEGIDSQA